MKSKGWYKIIKDEKYFDEFLGIFSDFHDYRITHMEYDCETNTLLLYLGYDTGLEGALLKFIHVEGMHICPCTEYESDWLSGATVKMTSSYSLIWCNADDVCDIDEIRADKTLTWIESEQIRFAWLDKDNQIIPLTDERLNPVWKIMSYETKEYESVPKHFRVFEV